ncbi:MAG TPA: putative glycoside hydrolase, partial [Lysobacter sp.]
FNSFHGTKMHGHKPLLTDVLKGRMHFGGFVVGDWNGHGLVKDCTSTNCPGAINAGLDMAMAPDSWKGFYESTLAAVKSGAIPQERLDDAVRRILRVKMRLGLFEAGKPSQRAVGGKFELLGSPEHRAVARQAVRESLVLLKNQGRVLPLQPKQRILVAGDGANDMGKQAGGWTLNWQGTGTKRADYPNADTIFEGIAQQVKAAGGEAVLAVDGKFTQKPDVAIVVFGENPYAEFQGDIPHLLYKPGNDADLELVKRLKAAGIPVVSVFLSGRPLWVNRELNASDAFVAAWLPGSEGGGIADVLLRKPDGSVQHDFKGKLSFSWPRTAAQYANNVGQKDYDPLFKFGFGLTYADAGDLAPLSEESGVKAGQTEAGTFYARGQIPDGMAMRLNNAAGHVIQVTTLPAALQDDSLKVVAVDHQAQEDARRYTWSGVQAATLSLSSQTPQDLSRETNGDVMLVLTLRPEQVPTEDVSIGVSCGGDCKATLPLREALAGLPVNEWTTLGVPLKCFAQNGADMTKLESVLQLQTAGKLQLSISRVALGASNEAGHVLPCAR